MSNDRPTDALNAPAVVLSTTSSRLSSLESNYANVRPFAVRFVVAKSNQRSTYKNTNSRVVAT